MSRFVGMLILFLFLAALAPLNAFPAETPLKVTFTPYPVKSCSSVNANWSGTFGRASSLYFQLVNDKVPGTIYWQSSLLTVNGSSAGQFGFRTERDWPATNSPNGSVYQMRSILNGAIYKSDALPILENKKNSPVVANDSTASGLEDQELSGVLFATDKDGELLSFSLATESPHGTVTIDSLDGTYTFTPAPNWSGTTSFSYFARDCQSESIGTVWVTIEPVNDAPLAIGSTAQGDEDSLILDQAAGTDVEASPLFYSVTTEPLNGVVSMGASGAYTFTPNANWFGATEFGFRVYDGELVSAEAMVSIVVNPVNDAPASFPGAFVGLEDEVLTGNVIGFDVEGDSLVFSVSTSPNENNGTLVLNANTGSFTFQPDANWYGETTFSFRSFDGIILSAPATITLTIQNVNDAPNGVEAQYISAQDTELVGNLTGFDIDGDFLTFSVVAQTAQGHVVVDSITGDFVFTPLAGWNGITSFTYVVSDGNLSSLAVTVSVTVLSAGGTQNLPPDPATIAPPLDLTRSSTMFEATSFLFTGENPIQRDVAADVISAERIVVLRGRVLNHAGEPLPGVLISITSHPEFGHTLSRIDGAFDIAANGGGYIAVNYQKNGYLEVQRKVSTPWADFVSVDDVTLTAMDSKGTLIYANAIEMQVAQSTPQTDERGTRQSTLLFPAGTTAWAITPLGDAIQLSQLTVRISEFTVGAAGPSAMPGELPPTSAYTFAAEFQVDEAYQIGATHVRFSQPVFEYLDNFINLPTGAIIPVGFYERGTSIWTPSVDGVVIQIIGTDAISGKALIDIDGDGNPESDASLRLLKFTIEELLLLANLYSPGKSLWRIEMDHFSVADFNLGPPVTSKQKPPMPPPPGGPPPPGPFGPCLGSKIECKTQALGEEIPIVNTPFTLNYQSDKTPGRANVLRLWLNTGGAFPPELDLIKLSVQVAGTTSYFHFKRSEFEKPGFQPFVDFQWLGKDAYGRPLQGRQNLTWTLDYNYAFKAYVFVRWDKREIWNHGFALYVYDPVYIEVETNHYRTLRTGGKATIGNWDAKAQDQMGGWLLSSHHGYDPRGRTLYMGDGSRRDASQVLGNLIHTYLQTKSSTTSTSDSALDSVSDPVSVSSLVISTQPADFVMGADGSIYLLFTCRILRISPSGIVSRFAGSLTCGYTGDGGPARNARFNLMRHMGIGPDGSIYVSDQWDSVIRKIDRSGAVRLIAGTAGKYWDRLSVPWADGFNRYAPDGTDAANTLFSWISSIAVDRFGNVYLSDNVFIRSIRPDGRIYTVAGSNGQNPAKRNYFNGAMAVDVKLDNQSRLAVGPDDALYIATSVVALGAQTPIIIKIDSDGRAQTVAGGGTATNDGVLAVESKLSYTEFGLGFDSKGVLYLVDNGTMKRIRAVSPEGVISTFAGGGATTCINGSCGDGDRATNASFIFPNNLIIGLQGELYVLDQGAARVRVIEPPLPGFSNVDFLLPSDDGSTFFQFSSAGRHLATFDALTGVVLFTFGYNEHGLITTIQDRDGLVTEIVREPSTGHANQIISPYGERTLLTMDLNGYLAGVEDPGGNKYSMTNDSNGLLLSYAKPLGSLTGGSYVFTYDGQGKLLTDTDPGLGTKTLIVNSQSDLAPDVSLVNPLGHSSRFQSLYLALGSQVDTATRPDGTTTIIQNDAAGHITTTLADGSVRTVTEIADPLLGLQAPLGASIVNRTPGGRVNTQTSARTVVLSNPANPFSLTKSTDTQTVNGRVRTSVYSKPTQTQTLTSPMGRTSTVLLDSLGRAVQQQLTGLQATIMGYDSLGRVTTVSQGTRLTALSYDSVGRLATITDSLMRGTSFLYDSSSRVESQTLPDNRVVKYSYDPNGNLTSVTPPGKTPHTFSFSPVDLVTGYDAPDAADGAGVTQYAYNLAKQLTSVTRPDGVVVNYLYEGDAGLPLPNPNTGRLKRITQPRGNTDFGYDTAGRLSTITAPDAGKLTYGYDGSLLLSTTWSNGAVNGSVSRTYNTRTFVEAGVTKTGSDFWVASESVNGANTVNFGYDLDGLLTSAGALTITRNAQNGLITGSSIGGVSDSVSYNGFAEPIGYNATFNGSSLYNVTYERDAIGRIASKTETVNGVTTIYGYHFDLVGRLTGVDKNGVASSTYTYDSNGNRLSYSGELGSFTGTYDAQDRLLSYGDFVYEYSANGELRRKENIATTEVWYFDYDAFGNLMKVELPNGDVVEYVIDGAQRRIGRKVNGYLTHGWLYSDQLTIVAELTPDGGVASRYFGDFMVKNGQTYRMVRDHLGSVKKVVHTSSGTVMQEIEYDEFGNILEDTNPTFQPFRYANGLYDDQSGLVRFGARDYDPAAGRWLSKDPIGFSGGDLNLYGYVLGDPVNLSDPNGQIPPLIIAGLVIAMATGGSLAVTAAMTELIKYLESIHQDEPPANVCPGQSGGDKYDAVYDAMKIAAGISASMSLIMFQLDALIATSGLSLAILRDNPAAFNRFFQLYLNSPQKRMVSEILKRYGL